MDAYSPRLGRASGAFALAAAVAIVFNTVVACAKDVYEPLKTSMASLAGSDWTTQGIADVVLFFVAGVILWKTSLAENITAKSAIRWLAGAAIVAGAGLFLWYFIY